MREVIRRAILIGHPGPEDRLLPGVGHDIENMCSFLAAPPGGGWRPEEITVLWMRTKEEILKAVWSVEADYLLVYYTGHGAGQLVSSGQGGPWPLVVQRWLEVSSGVYIEDLALINERVPRQLVVCDCCRTRPPARISGIPDYLERVPFTKKAVETARMWLDWFIRLSPVGRTIVHSTADGRSAMDSSEGGMFSLALLMGALRRKTGSAYSGIAIESLVDYTRILLGVGEDPQKPEITHKTGVMTVPFALNTPWPLPPGVVPGATKQSRSLKPADDSLRTDLVGPTGEAPLRNPVNGWLMLGGIALGVWLFSGSE